MTERRDIGDLLAERPLPELDGGKHDRGTLLVVGGAATCPGAAILAGTAALRAGAGRVQLVTHPDVAAAVGATFPEAFVLAWDPTTRPPEVLARRIGRAQAVLVGPGLRDDGPAAARAVAELVDADVPLVLDATSIPAATDLCDRDGLVVTPNDTEAGRLLGDGAAGDDVEALACRVAERLGGRPTAVRGVESVVTDGAGRTWHNRSGAGGLGTAGSGDVAVGILGGLLARGVDAVTAIGWAVAVHARAGALAAADVGPVGFLAREVADRIPRALSVVATG